MTASTLAQVCTEDWCSNHIADEDLTMHASVDVRVPMTAGGPAERGYVVTAVERDDVPGESKGMARVRLEVCQRGTGLGLDGGPMTPEQALTLSRELERAARLALQIGAQA